MATNHRLHARNLRQIFCSCFAECCGGLQASEGGTQHVNRVLIERIGLFGDEVLYGSATDREVLQVLLAWQMGM